MKIYTRFGDKGKTRLADGSCVDKNNPRVECYGNVDELNSFLGLSATLLAQNRKKLKGDLRPLLDDLLVIQNQLFNLGSLLAREDQKILHSLPQLDEKDVEGLERSIDRMTRGLPPLNQFILPGGSLLASYLHIARTVCRRTERSTIELAHTLEDEKSGSAKVLEIAIIYLNRLSDFLFTAARTANYAQKINDQIWQRSVKR